MRFEKRGDITPEEAAAMEKAETPADTSEKTMKKRREAVIMYAAALLIVTLALIALSYFIQQRRANDTINSMNEQHSQFTIQALQNIEELQNKNLELSDALDEANVSISSMQDSLEESGKALEELRQKNEQLKDELELREEQIEALEAVVRAENAFVDGDIDEAQAAFTEAKLLEGSLPEGELGQYMKRVAEEIEKNIQPNDVEE